MPANLSAQAKGLWSKYQSAKSVNEKLRALEAFHSAIPKHKGNERLQAQVKRKIASLRLELKESRRRKSGGMSARQLIEKTGAAQVVILGATNSGRSSLLSALTNARPAISSREFTTLDPIPGVMSFEDIQLQLIEAPPLIDGAADGESWGPLTLDLARNADALILVVDISQDPSDQIRMLTSELEKAGISLRRLESNVVIAKSSSASGIHVAMSGGPVDFSADDVKRVLKGYGLRNASVIVSGKATLEDVEDAVLESRMIYKPSIIVANKVDREGSAVNLTTIEGRTGRIPVVTMSCVTGEGIALIGPALFEIVGVIRIYTKQPNQPKHSPEPFILEGGSTIAELARRIHSELADRLRYARIWGTSAKYPGEKVGPNHVLSDRDIVEMR